MQIYDSKRGVVKCFAKFLLFTANLLKHYFVILLDLKLELKIVSLDNSFREKNMVSQITQGIKVSVFTDFEGSYFKNHRIHYAFSYRVTIENQSKDTVQLLFRHWDIFDALSETEAIDGEGVVGNKPILKSGESHTYTSGCLLTSPFGAMKGFYTMVNFTTTRKFKVSIPTFRLGAVFALN